MKKLLAILAFLIPIFCFGQSTSSLITNKHGGVYSWTSKETKDRGGVIYIYPESNTTVLFYMGLNRGAPSYNMGELYGRMNITNGTGVFFNSSYPGSDCKFRLTFSGEKLIAKTMEEKYDCLFGAGVIADGEFSRQSAKIPEYFEGYEGKVYFKTTKPEQYYR
ncbi:MAG: hypothetical protein RLZZ358_539 [Bacteroidota bacterium]|jgi:hypothetical protein